MIMTKAVKSFIVQATGGAIFLLVCRAKRLRFVVVRKIQWWHYFGNFQYFLFSMAKNDMLREVRFFTKNCEWMEIEKTNKCLFFSKIIK